MQELGTVVEQHNSLLENNNILDNALRQMEAQFHLLATAQLEIASGREEAEAKVKALSNELPSLAQEVEQQIHYEFSGSLPQPGDDPEKDILDVWALGNMKANTWRTVEELKAQQNAEGRPKQRSLAILAHLEDALRFIQTLSLSDADPGQGSLGTETAIGVSNLPKGFNLFDWDAFAGAGSQLQKFLRVATAEQLGQLPVRELFAVFTEVTLLNKMLRSKSWRRSLQRSARLGGRRTRC
jgi:hypothetical protein